MHARRPVLTTAAACLIVLAGWAPTAAADEVNCSR